MLDWRSARLVVFDVDGTLYDQAPLRGRMAIALGLHCLGKASLSTAMALRFYRKEREKLADAEVEDFEDILRASTADHAGLSRQAVDHLIDQWIEQKPLPFLLACRRPGVAEFFKALRASGVKIGILSDYPAHAKLAALDLPFDHSVSAADPEVRVMKPHPRGLRHVMEIAGATPEETLFIGDRAERDAAAGARAGVRTWLIAPREPASDDRFASFRDLLEAPRFEASRAA